MFQKKDFIRVILLSIFTCGIYGIIFMYEYDREVRAMYRRGTHRPVEFLLAFILALLTCGIFIYWWYYTLYRFQAEEAAALGVVLNVEDPIVMTLCMIIPFFGIYLLCDNYNKIFDAMRARGEI